MSILFKKFISVSAPVLPIGMLLERCTCALVVWCLAVLISNAGAETVTLQWDANSDADLAGYKVHYGVTSGTYDNTIDAENMTEATVSNLDLRTTYFFVVTAYNFDGVESLPSNEVTYTTGPGNRAPVAAGQSIDVVEDQSKDIMLAGSDIDGDPLTFSIADGPTHGTLRGTPPSVVYSPTANYSGSDSFTFTVSDGTLTSTPATVTVTVAAMNDVPAAAAQSVVTPEDASVALTVTGSDADGDILSYAIISPPARGTLSGNPPNLIYVPEPDYHGEDTFAFGVSDGVAFSLPATVTVTVESVDDAPRADTQSVTTQEDTPCPIQLGGSDADGTPLTFLINDLPAHGTLSGTPPSVVYSPTADFSGSDSFTFRVSDGAHTSAPATVSVMVTAVPDAESYTQWIAAAGFTGVSAEPDADPDQDGMKNFSEFAFNGNPAVPGDIAFGGSTVNIDGKNWLVLHYRRWDEREQAGVSYLPEASTNLIDWSLSDVIDEPDPDAEPLAGSSPFRARIEIGAAPRFLRMDAQIPGL